VKFDPQEAHSALTHLSAPNTVDGEVRSCDYRELILDILHMKYVDVERLSRRVTHVRAHEGSKVRRAFRTRMAELLTETTLEDLDNAGHALAVLRAMDEALPCDDFWAETDAWPSSCSAQQRTSWQCPTRALEERIGKLAFQNRSRIDVLVRCHGVVTKLVDHELMRPKILNVIMSCLAIWIERTPLPEVRRRVGAVRSITSAEPPLLLALERRVIQRSRDAFTAGQLQGFAQFLLDVERGGLALLEGVGPAELDPESARRFPGLQVGLTAALRICLSRWPMRRLVAEFRGPVIRLICSWSSILENVRGSASARVCEALRSVHAMVLREVLPTVVQEELLHWGEFLKTLNTAGLLSLAEPDLDHILGGLRVPGSLLHCCASVTPGTVELLPAYRGRARELQVRTAEVNAMVVEVSTLLANMAEDTPMEPDP